ncbi:pilus assembly protein TadG-related protein [Agromyces allii]|uniref:Putative Flp pilus-assembly TadG-like N-terminal domain-containing protein n=1 Tax=Agromyces allii TaxID=393607 RepID=A0ABP5BQU2_9MICO|nr:pilus assembly protein TadG-related protein [Agromyces allii]
MPPRRRVVGEAPELLDDEVGSTLLLTIFFSFLALVIMLVVVGASSLYLERKRLFTLADGAALAGAEAWSLDEVSIDGDALSLELDDAAVHAAVAAYLGDAAGRLDGVELVGAASRDGRSATVTLRAVWHAPLHTELLPLSVPIEVTTTARSVFH